jgi:hypothetical protein
LSNALDESNYNIINNLPTDPSNNDFYSRQLTEVDDAKEKNPKLNKSMFLNNDGGIKDEKYSYINIFKFKIFKKM